MYCPRCGSQNTDATKFCRQCGLSLTQIMGYVAGGGTGSFPQPPPPLPPPTKLPETSEMLAVKQKRILTIISVCIAPVIFAIIGSEMLGLDDLAGIPFLLVPLGIVWALFRYKMQLRRLQERQLEEYYARQQQYQQMPQQAPTPKLVLQPQSDQSQPAQLNAPRTNPLAEASRGSVVEDETRKFPEHH